MALHRASLAFAVALLLGPFATAPSMSATIGTFSGDDHANGFGAGNFAVFGPALPTFGQYCSRPVIGTYGVTGYAPLLPPIFDPLGNLAAATAQGPGFRLRGDAVNLTANINTNGPRGSGLRLPVVYGPNGVLFGTVNGSFHAGQQAGNMLPINQFGSNGLPHVFRPTTSVAPRKPTLQVGKPYRTVTNRGPMPNGFGRMIVYHARSAGGAHGHR